MRTPRIRPKWPEYFMAIAKAVSARSGDPDGKSVGAVITTGDDDNTIISTGYNGFPRDIEPHLHRSATKTEKLRWMCHAEQNAISNAARLGGRSTQGAILYTTRFPCLQCAKAIVQAGITVVHTADSAPYEDELLGDDGSRVFDVFREAGIKLKASALGRTRTTVSKSKPRRGHYSRIRARR